MEEQIDLIVNKYIDEEFFPSAVCQIFDGGKTIYNKAFGGVTTDTVFDVASLSKIITSTEILMLISEGKIDLYEKIKKYIPIITEYKVLNERLGDVTIEQLLTHNSGIIDWYPLYVQEGTVFDAMDKIIGQYEKFEGTHIMTSG